MGYVGWISLILHEFLVGILMFGATVSTIVGLMILLSPENIAAVSERLNASYSLRRTTRVLDLPRQYDDRLLRAGPLLGGLTLLCSLAILYSLLYHLNLPTLVSFITIFNLPSEVSEILGTSLYLISLALTLFSFAISTILVVHPTLVGSLQGWANRWLTSRQVSRRLDRSYTPLDQLLVRRPVTIGVLITFGSIYILIRLIADLWQTVGQ